MYFEIYGLYPSKFLSATGLALKVALKNTKIKLDDLNGINVLLMVRKGIRRGICQFIYRYAKDNE